MIMTTIEHEDAKKPQGQGPLAEIEYWRERYGPFSTLFEQIGMPTVQKIIQVLENEKGDTSMLPGFKDQYTELNKHYVEAKDNVKFLSTLERHFKNIAHGSFSSIQETLPSMMNALRMVWVISRHYNSDERMVPLMERIAWQLCEKVTAGIGFPAVFKEPSTKALKKIEEGRNVLEKWKETYFATRDKIDTSGGHGRWDFDRKRLFEKTSYMSDRCNDIREVVQVLEHFHNILNNDLKSKHGWRTLGRGAFSTSRGISHVVVLGI